MSNTIGATRRDRPPALHPAPPPSDTKYVLDGDHTRLPPPAASPSSLVPPPPLPEAERASSTGSVSSSSLDPYYFSAPDPTPTTPDPAAFDPGPITPARDPAAIDRSGLVGVGELTTPRWATRQGAEEWTVVSSFDTVDSAEKSPQVEDEESDPSSPWTIEAVDGDGDELEPLPPQPDPPTRTIRPKPSVTSESGGEEILYPRKPHPVPSVDSMRSDPVVHTEGQQQPVSIDTPPLGTTSPPSAFIPQPKAKKRTSDEFLMDNSTGTLVSKSASLKAEPVSSIGPSASARKHRSLGAPTASSSARIKDRRRGASGTVLAIELSPNNSNNGGRHVRHVSASASASSSSSETHGRRTHGYADFSHLPPSPSSTSIQQFLRSNAGSNSVTSPNATSHTVTSETLPPIHRTSPSVAHSLLRGTQEGWSALDDQETIEALRKLDGLTGKTVHARSSVNLSAGKGSSRPGTPGRGAAGTQWEGIEPQSRSKRQSVASTKGGDDPKSRRSSAGSGKDKAEAELPRDITSQEPNEIVIHPQAHAEEAPAQLSPHTSAPTVSARGGAGRRPGSNHSPTRPHASFVAKRGSASSTSFAGTPTTSSRDSTTFSASTSATSAVSARSSFSKARRNSAGSDVSSVHSNDAAVLRERTASLASGVDVAEDKRVPPVPPLPEHFASYKLPVPSLPPSATNVTFPTISPVPVEDLDRTVSLDNPPRFSPDTSSPKPLPAPPLKSPAKKWSFASGFNLKLQSSSSSRDLRSAARMGTPLSAQPERPISFAYTTESAGFPEPPYASSTTTDGWSVIPPHAIPGSDGETLTARSSMSSLRVPTSPAPISPVFLERERDRDPSPSFSNKRTPERSDTASSTSTSQAPQSPRQQSRLTPSAIPFFRRSSSQSLYQQRASPAAQISAPSLQAVTTPSSSSPPPPPPPPASTKNVTTPLSPTKKTSVFGLQALLKGSSSRKSVQAEKDREREEKRERMQEKERERVQRKEDDKDRSESRISMLMGRKRGKTLSSTEQKKTKIVPVPLPPIQMSAIPPATAQRVANLKPGASSHAPSGSNLTRSTTTSSRLTASTVSSMNKQSEASVRLSRNQLPTIAGSPSANTNGTQPNSNQGSVSSQSTLTKETPTKIPRIASRSSTMHSPTNVAKSNASVVSSSRRTSLNLGTFTAEQQQAAFDEFGMMENGDGSAPGAHAYPAPYAQRTSSIRTSPQPTSRVSRTLPSSVSSTALPRKSNRDSVSFTGLRKSSTGSIAIPPATQPEPTTRTNRLSMLSPSKSLKLLTPKLSSPKTHVNSSSSPSFFKTGLAASASSSRQSLSSPSPVPSGVDEEEFLGDEEMMEYIRRQQTKKLANGVSKEELEGLFKFPEPSSPVPAQSPNDVLRGSLGAHLSPFERQEILDYHAVHYVGQGSKKNHAMPDIPTNNHGYDDEKCDYIVIPHDHLAYRYEIVDTLGKGSFGQVLNCKDHATGQSVAIKIIRNKKRFHHQALVEIKILDSLRKWDSDEKHHVIKMTEHFYFRNHLCIAMELLSINLYELIKANGFIGFTTNLIRRFTSQMLSSLALMRQHRIVHCDLKPENVLLRHPTKSAIKVIDFGSSCFEHEKVYTYIQSRFYRSPEVILGMNYHAAIDMWSLGCILAELYTGYPIFPGENEQEQLSCIMEVLGQPDKDFINRSSRKKLFFDQSGAPRPVVNSKGRRRRPGTKTLAQVLRCDDELFVDFIAKCLIWDPERRLKPQPAMRHPFLTSGRSSRTNKTISSTPSKSLLSSSSSTFSSSSRITTKVMETPKKSQIGAPTPLTARSTRAPTTTVPQTPVGSNGLSLGPRYRSSVSSSHHSSRYAAATVTK